MEPSLAVELALMLLLIVFAALIPWVTLAYKTTVHLPKALRWVVRPIGWLLVVASLAPAVVHAVLAIGSSGTRWLPGSALFRELMTVVEFATVVVIVADVIWILGATILVWAFEPRRRRALGYRSKSDPLVPASIKDYDGNSRREFIVGSSGIVRDRVYGDKSDRRSPALR